MEPKKRLGAEQRIRRQTTFQNLVEKGKFARGDFFYLWVGERNESGRTTRAKPMIGISVSRKTEAKAVGRNLWKRRIREIFRSEQEKLRQDAVCLVKVRTGKKQPSFAAAQEDLIKLFKKAGAWA